MSSVSSTSGVSDFLQQNAFDLNGRYNATNKTQGATSNDHPDQVGETGPVDRTPKNELDFDDMLLLMCTQLQNQSIDNTADTNDMMNQLISMTVMKSLTTLTSAVEEVQTASVMNYAASMVGKEVTLGVYDENGNIQEIYGVVEASGTYDGNQVIFVDGQSYYLSSIMAVGKLPPKKDDDTELDVGGTTKPGDTTDGSDKTDTDNTTNTDKTDTGNSTENTDVENSGAAGGVTEEENITEDGTDSDNGAGGAAETAQV